MVLANSSQVNLLTLVNEMRADPQLHQALQVPGTALLGLASDGVPLMVRLASPDVTHVSISGSKDCGKTDIVRTMLASLVLYQKPGEIQLLVMDPKGGAFDFLDRTPHLLGGIATAGEQALQQLRWLENELEFRETQNVTRPHLVVAIDELAEMMAQGGREFKVHLARLAQRGRRAGISLLLCSFKQNASELDASLKANFPVRLVGRQAGGTQANAAQLKGRGDFILMAGGERVRFQGAHFPPHDLPAFYELTRRTNSKANVSRATVHRFLKRLRAAA